MGKRDEYISGPHSFWIHFGWGLVFGAVLSTWISNWFFDSTTPIVVSAALGALAIAYCCARWGDSAWYWLIERLRWIP